jgi:hypothetical protein
VEGRLSSARATSDGSLHLVCELDERLGFRQLVEQQLCDGRGKNTQLPPSDLVRQSVYNQLAGYEGANDAERHSQDPAFHLIGSKKIMKLGGGAIAFWGRRCCIIRLNAF